MASPVLRGPFTVESYQRLGELGILGEDDRVELIHGQIVALTPIGDRHASCVRRLHDLIARDAIELAIIDVQNPVVLGRQDAPQPDLAVLKRRPDRYPQHPRAPDILLVIEVADTSPAYDRDIKIPLYGKAGIPEAWLVDLTGEGVGVYRDPRAGVYAHVQWSIRGDALTPVRLPQVALAVTDILGS